jgi:hypothetical protein
LLRGWSEPTEGRAKRREAGPGDRATWPDPSQAACVRGR